MLSLQSSETLNEYSYSSLPMWAGPAQWKNRAQFDDLKGSFIRIIRPALILVVFSHFSKPFLNRPKN